MKWLLILLLPLTVLANIFQFEVPQITDPIIKDTEIEVPETPQTTTEEPMVFEPYQELMNAIYSHVNLTDKDIEELQKEYPDVTGSWKGFKIDIDVNRNEWLKGSPKSIARLMAFRRVFLREKTFNDYQQAENVLLAGFVDYFDEYDVKKQCNKEEIQVSGSFEDSIHIDHRKKVHFIRKTLDCDFEYRPCGLFFHISDQNQGVSDKFLAGLKLRVDGGKKVEVKEWRKFTSCATQNYSMGPYPEFSERLQELGFAETDILSASPEVLLGLRKFAQGPLREWRKTVPGFTDEKISRLENRERKEWNYEYLQELRKLITEEQPTVVKPGIAVEQRDL